MELYAVMIWWERTNGEWVKGWGFVGKAGLKWLLRHGKSNMLFSPVPLTAHNNLQAGCLDGRIVWWDGQGLAAPYEWLDVDAQQAMDERFPARGTTAGITFDGEIIDVADR